MQKNIFLFICSLFLLCPLVNAQSVPSPYTVVKDKVVISQFHTLEQPSTPEGIFVNALLWAIDHREFADLGEEEKEKMAFAVDYDKRQFTVELMQKGDSSGACYNSLFSVKVADNIITILASDISCETQVAPIKLIRRMPFEKLQPEKKEKHKENLDEFAALYEAYAKQMLEYIVSTKSPVITHWTEIKAKEVVKGMTAAECLLSMGKPASVQKSGGKEEWMYDSYTYLFFENGKLASFIK